MMGLLAAVAAAVLMAPGVASAEPYPAEPPAAEISDGTVEPGGTVTFAGEGFLPFEKISINVGYEGSDSPSAFRPEQVGGFVLASTKAQVAKRVTLTTTADANGRFSIEVPLTQVGNATLVATGLTSGVTVTTTVEVLDPSAGGGGDDGAGEDGSGDNGAGGDDNDKTDDVALPTTGPSSTPLLVAVFSGVGFLFLGAALLWVSRARRHDTTV